MSRRNTKAIKSINRMYEQFNLKSDEIIHKTKLLLSIYRDVVWATLNESEYISDEVYYFGDDLTNALVYLEEFASDTDKAEFEARISTLFENKWMIDLIDKANCLRAVNVKHSIAHRQAFEDARSGAFFEQSICFNECLTIFSAKMILRSLSTA